MHPMMARFFPCYIHISAFILQSVFLLTHTQSVYWPQYGNDECGSRFSPLTDINKNNVNHLQVAWKFHYGSQYSNPDPYGVKATPLMIEDGTGSDVLVFCTPWNDLIALDAKTGSLLWNQTIGSPSAEEWHNFKLTTCRGVASWLDSLKSDKELCRSVVFMSTLNELLIAVDAATGTLCPQFGNSGVVNLTHQNSWDEEDGKWTQIRYYGQGPTVVRNVVIVGSAVYDSPKMPPGLPAGFDCRTGEKRWEFNVVPQNTNNPAYNTWWNGTENMGGGNVWGPMSGDDETGMVYLPTSAGQVSYYGGTRWGNNDYCTSLVALDVETGEYMWHYQVVHHDIWNYDLAAQPTITTIYKAGGRQKVVLVSTKTGMLFILDALSGTPVYPVFEHQVAQTEIPEEWTSPTQPILQGDLGHLLPDEFNVETDMFEHPTDVNHHERCQQMLAEMNITKTRHLRFDPFTAGRGMINTPGQFGGSNWWSMSVDPNKYIGIIVYRNDLQVMGLYNRNDPNIPNWCTDIQPHGTPYVKCQRHFEVSSGSCHKEPWDIITAVNLNTGEKLWQQQFGIGRVNGGVFITASGLIIGSNWEDQHLWIHDLEYGGLLFSYELGQPGGGTPITYKVQNRQFIVVNGGNPGEESLIAFALPAL